MKSTLVMSNQSFAFELQRLEAIETGALFALQHKEMKISFTIFQLLDHQNLCIQKLFSESD